MSPGLMLSLIPDCALPRSEGSCHSGASKRGKNNHSTTATGSACAEIRPA